MDIKLVNVRLAFPSLFHAKSFAGEDGKQSTPAYQATFLLQANDKQVAGLKAAMKTLAVEKWGAKGEAVFKTLEAQDKLCLHNGDNKADMDGFAGCWFVSSRAPTKPLVIDRDRSPLTAESGRPYGGCYVDARIDVYCQDNKFGKRINASLKGVQFRRDGDAFAGGAPAKEGDFDDLSDTGEGDASLV